MTVLHGVMEKTLASLRAAAMDLASTICKTLAAKLIDAIPSLQDFLTQLRGIDELNPTNAKELLELLTKEDGATSFNAWFAAYEKCEDHPNAIYSGLDESRTPTTSRMAFAKLAGVPEQQLNTAAVLNVCIVTLQAAFGPQRGHSKQALLQIAMDVKTTLLKDDSDLPRAIALIHKPPQKAGGEKSKSKGTGKSKSSAETVAKVEPTVVKVEAA